MKRKQKRKKSKRKLHIAHNIDIDSTCINLLSDSTDKKGFFLCTSADNVTISTMRAHSLLTFESQPQSQHSNGRENNKTFI